MVPRSKRMSDNPVVASRRAAGASLAREIGSRPLVSILLALSCVAALGAVAALVTAGIAHHAGILLGWLEAHAPLLWSAIFLACLANQVPPLRRELEAAHAGWLSALPQMPAAMRPWSRWRRWTLAALQSLGLVTVVGMIHREAAPALAPTPIAWLPPVLVPALAALLAPVLAGRRRRNDRIVAPPSRAPAASRDGARALPRWQWLHYRSRCWGVGVRWSVGLLIVLMPAGASAVQVGIGLAVGLVLLQTLQLWSSSLRVVFEASALLRALPLRPWRFALQASVLPLSIAAALSLAAALLLAALGLSLPGAVVAGLALLGTLTLHLAVVLAWRNESRFAGLRSALVLLAWLVFAQSAPFAAPLIWLALTAWLLGRAGRVAP